MTTTPTFAAVLSIAIKSAESAPMAETDSAIAIENGTLAGSAPTHPDRGVTFLSQVQWADVMKSLASNLPWHTRRANILLNAERLSPLIGKRIRVGNAELEVIGETHPCGLMDAACPGLKKALTPECRGGVHARVTRSGAIRIGDAVTVLS